MTGPSERDTQLPFLSGLTTEQLLLIEQVCDQFEADFQVDPNLAIESYLVKLPVELHRQACIEMQALQESWRRNERTHDAEELHTLRAQADHQWAGRPTIASTDASGSRPLRAGRFELHELLGSGGAGAVWRAFDRHLARWVALKTPLANTVIDPDKVLQEARTAARLRHPNIVGVLDAGQDELGCFIIHELVEGMTLADKLAQAPYTPREAAKLVSTLAAAVAYAHQAGVVHRDLKPQNILIDADQRPMILDFGLACEWFTGLPNTYHGKLAGTPAYMAPEQAAGRSIRAEPRTDVYALGVILFQLLTGELPFRGDVSSVLHQVVYAEPPRALELSPQVPLELDILCQCCLEKSVARRLASAAFLHEELERYLQHQPIQSRPSSWRSRAAKWFYRNPVVSSLATLASLMIVLLLVGAIATSIVVSRAWEREHILRMEAERERLSAVEARDKQREALEQALEAKTAAHQSQLRAEAESLLSDASLQYLESMIQSSDPVSWVLQTSVGPVTEAPQLADWLDAAAERTRVELVGQPRLQARMLDTLANGCRSLGRYREASNLLDQAELIRGAATASEHAPAPIELVRHQFYRALIFQDKADFAHARQLLLSTLHDCVNLPTPVPLLEADIRFHLGWNYSLAREFEAAVSHFQQALQIRRTECPADSGLIKAAQLALEYCRDAEDGQLSVRQLQAVLVGDDRYSRIVNEYLKMLAWRQLGRWKEASNVYQSILEQLSLALPAKHPLLVLAHGEYAEVCWRSGDFRRALPAIEKVIHWAEELSPDDVRLRQVREIFGHELLRSQRFDEAGEQFRRLIERDTRTGDRFSASAYEGMVWVRLISGHTDEAIDLSEQLLLRTQSEPAYRRAWYHYVHARAAALGGENDMEEKSNQQSYQLACSVTELPQDGLWLERLANIFTREKQYDRSLEILEKAIARERSSHPAQHPHLADRLVTYARVLKQAHRDSESRRALEEAEAIYKASLPQGDRRLVYVVQGLQN